MMHQPYAAANLETMRYAKCYAAAIGRLVAEHLGEPSGAVVDFGAGTGSYAAALAGTGRRIVAVEPDTALHAHYPETLPRAASLAELEPARAVGAYSLNVFEHIDDDASALRELTTRLCPGAPVFILVPADMRLWTAMDDLVGHRRRYTPESLRALGAQAGLVWQAGGWFDRTGYLAARLLRGILRIPGRRRDWDGQLNPVHVKLFDQGFRLVEPVLAKLALPFGKNCWAVFAVPAPPSA